MICKDSLEKFLAQRNIPAYRTKQILHAVYKEGKDSFSQMTVLPKTTRDVLSRGIDIFSFKEASERISASGNAIKTLLRLKDNDVIEAVLMRFSDSRNSVCVSSQAGCGLKCAFCATGALGFRRNLSSEEISDQVLYFDQKLKRENKNVTNVVFMGMGEPLLNYENVMNSVKSLNNPELFGIAARRITISTSGIATGIEKLACEKLQFNLAVSLHAPDQILRERLMPIAKAYPLNRLMAAIKTYMEKTRRRVSYEYIMLRDVNDSQDCARKLAKLLAGQLCHVNLIPYNETNMGFKNAGRTKIKIFKDILDSFGIPVTVRVSLGQDIAAACGQLAGLNN